MCQNMGSIVSIENILHPKELNAFKIDTGNNYYFELERINGIFNNPEEDRILGDTMLTLLNIQRLESPLYRLIKEKFEAREISDIVYMDIIEMTKMYINWRKTTLKDIREIFYVASKSLNENKIFMVELFSTDTLFYHITFRESYTSQFQCSYNEDTIRISKNIKEIYMSQADNLFKDLKSSLIYEISPGKMTDDRISKMKIFGYSSRIEDSFVTSDYKCIQESGRGKDYTKEVLSHINDNLLNANDRKKYVSIYTISLLNQLDQRGEAFLILKTYFSGLKLPDKIFMSVMGFIQKTFKIYDITLKLIDDLMVISTEMYNKYASVAFVYTDEENFHLLHFIDDDKDRLYTMENKSGMVGTYMKIKVNVLNRQSIIAFVL